MFLLLIFRKKIGLQITNKRILNVAENVKNKMPKGEYKHTLDKEIVTNGDKMKTIEKRLLEEGISKKEKINILSEEKPKSKKTPKRGKYLRYINQKIKEGMTRKEAADEWRRQIRINLFR